MKLDLYTDLSIEECSEKLKAKTYHRKRRETSVSPKTVWGNISGNSFKLTVMRPWFLELIPLRVSFKGRWKPHGSGTEIRMRTVMNPLMWLFAGLVNVGIIVGFLIVLFRMIYTSLFTDGPSQLVQVFIYIGLFYFFLLLYGFNHYFKNRKRDDAEYLKDFVISALHAKEKEIVKDQTVPSISNPSGAVVS